MSCCSFIVYLLAERYWLVIFWEKIRFHFFFRLIKKVKNPILYVYHTNTQQQKKKTTKRRLNILIILSFVAENSLVIQSPLKNEDWHFVFNCFNDGNLYRLILIQELFRRFFLFPIFRAIQWFSINFKVNLISMEVASTHHAVISYQLFDPIFCRVPFRHTTYRLLPLTHIIHKRVCTETREKQLLTHFYIPKKGSKRKSFVKARGWLFFTVSYLFFVCVLKHTTIYCYML